jgi:hypothetical protein
MALTAVEVLEKISPTGPCVPGLGITVLIFLIPVIAFLTIINCVIL